MSGSSRIWSHEKFGGKVTRSALQNAASIASMVLTTESIVADKPAKEGAAMPAMPPMGGGMPGMM